MATSGFSLVEVVLAIGVVAFAFVGIFALLPAGMGVFRQAMDTSVSAQIVQRIASDAVETDFDELISNSPSGNYYTLPVRYFDDQGSEVKVADPASPSSAEKAGPPGILYWVRVRGTVPGQPNPGGALSGYPLPTSGTSFSPRDSTLLTIQIANNPAGKVLPVGSANLIDPNGAKTSGMLLQTYSVVITRSSYYQLTSP